MKHVRTFLLSLSLPPPLFFFTIKTKSIINNWNILQKSFGWTLETEYIFYTAQSNWQKQARSIYAALMKKNNFEHSITYKPKHDFAGKRLKTKTDYEP